MLEGWSGFGTEGCPGVPEVLGSKVRISGLYPQYTPSYLANGQPFKLLGITYLVGKIKFKLFFSGSIG